MNKMSMKINTSISVLIAVILGITISTIIYFQYKSSNEFVKLTTEKVFLRVSDKVINRVQRYDNQSINFINLVQKIEGLNIKPSMDKKDTFFPIIANHISSKNYIYGIYLGYDDDSFYMVYNLNVSKKLKSIKKAPKDARWLIKRNIKEGNNTISYLIFKDSNLKTLTITKSISQYRPTIRPWYKSAINSSKVIKTDPYTFASIGKLGVTYAKKIDNQGTVLGLDITLNSLNQLLQHQDLVSGSKAFLFKNDGEIIARRDIPRNINIKDINKIYPNIFIKNGNIVDLNKQTIVNIDGKEYIKYTTLLQSTFNTKEYLSILSPFDVLMKPYKNKIYEILIITLMVLLIIILPLVIYAVKLLVRPIKQLNYENKKIENGDFHNIEEVDTFIVEISNLSQSMINMAKSIEEHQRTLEYKVEQRTQELEESKKEVEEIHKHTRESIEYASFIQGALIPKTNSLAPFFKDYFATWTPKDTVGGDIWLFSKLRHEDECLLFFIDCTGHGVPGAFVTMIVKAIEREIVSKLKKHSELDISPAIIMGYFNKTMKKLLRQESEESLSNAGFDGGIIYYNRRTQILKFCGAETPLFYVDNDGEFHTIKGNRYSVGYKKCDINYKYKETILEVQEGMKFYCTTDGYLDQNGGDKDFPFGKKRFGNIIKQNYKQSMADIQAIFQLEMMEWEDKIPNNDRNDDMTLIGFEIGEKNLHKERL